jgi:hypothetical protein
MRRHIAGFNLRVLQILRINSECVNEREFLNEFQDSVSNEVNNVSLRRMGGYFDG